MSNKLRHWDLATIFIKTKKSINIRLFVESLGLKIDKKVAAQYFCECMYPSYDFIFLGIYKDLILINSPKLVDQFFSNDPSEIETKLISHFPNTDIGVFSIRTIDSHWGYSIFQNSKKIRTRFGDSKKGTQLEFGEILKEEEALFAWANYDSKGKRYFKFLGFMDHERFYEEEVGEDFIFSLSKRFLKSPLDETKDLLYETKLEGFKLLTQNDV